MPTYDYECSACGHTFEEFQSITAEPLKKCPSCRKSKLRRLIGTGAGIIFKGSGFYQTDYRSESYKQAAKADSEKSSGGEKKAESSEPKSGSSGPDSSSSASSHGESSKSSDKSAPKKSGKKCA